MRIIIKTLLGSSENILKFEIKNPESIVERFDPEAFARICYTNHGAHAPVHTWYPVSNLKSLKSDWKFSQTI